MTNHANMPATTRSDAVLPALAPSYLCADGSGHPRQFPRGWRRQRSELLSNVSRDRDRRAASVARLSRPLDAPRGSRRSAGP